MAQKEIVSTHELPDKHQSIWQLSAIQLCGWTSLPILGTSVLILKNNSFYGAVLTIIVGNAILWFIRLAIIAMTYKKRLSALDISQAYLGSMGSYFIGALLNISTLVWFITQTTAASNTLTNLLNVSENPTIDKFTQISVVLGVISTLLCMGGIVFLRKLTSIAFPLLITAFIIVLFTSPFHIPKNETASLSLSGLTLVLATNLGITSELPTFFRHSKSIQTSIGALTIIQLISLGLALCGLFFGSIISENFAIVDPLILGNGNEVLRISLIVFVFLSVICANVANVYSASVGWEVIAPSALVGRQEYLILGLGLTAIFILVSNIFSLDILLNATDFSLVNLCIVLILGFAISRVKKSPISFFEQQSYFAAWLVATLINILQFCGVFLTEYSPLVVGLITVLIVLVARALSKALTALIQNSNRHKNS